LPNINVMDIRNEKVSIVVLTHNALNYCRIFFKSISITCDVKYELVVVDNDSSLPNKIYLFFLFLIRRINKLIFLDTNTFYAKGNNIGAMLSSEDSSHILFVNSDVKFSNPRWLFDLLKAHEYGITAYGVAEKSGYIPRRADGYCFLINRDLFLKYKFDEAYPFWWSFTKLEGELLRDSYSVKAVKNHEKLIHHYGGKSGRVPNELTEGKRLSEDEIGRLFGTNGVTIVESLD
jgi:GT2 family glycosyltransferase